MTSSFPTDSYLFLTGDDAEQTEWPATRFPEYTDERLTQFVDHLRAMSNDDLASGLPALSSAGLYTLVVVLAKAAGVGHGSWTADARITEQLPAATPALLAELRRRDCQGMGYDPTGPVRRGRLLQLVGAFTLLSQLGATTRQRRKMRGDCPFCNANRRRCWSRYPAVTWRCFECDRSGGLREFAECLLTSGGERLGGPGTASLAQTRYRARSMVAGAAGDTARTTRPSPSAAFIRASPTYFSCSGSQRSGILSAVGSTSSLITHTTHSCRTRLLIRTNPSGSQRFGAESSSQVSATSARQAPIPWIASSVT